MAICSSTWIQNYHCHTAMCKPSQSTSEQGCSLMGCPQLKCSQVRGFINPFIHVSNKLRLFGEVVLVCEPSCLCTSVCAVVVAVEQAWGTSSNHRWRTEVPLENNSSEGGSNFHRCLRSLTKSTPVRGLNGSNKTAITALQWHLVLLPGTVSFLKIKVC